jgi:hypothetical protein
MFGGNKNEHVGSIFQYLYRTDVIIVVKVVETKLIPRFPMIFVSMLWHMP